MTSGPQETGDRQDGSRSRRQFLAVIGGSAVVGLGAGLSQGAENPVPKPSELNAGVPPAGDGIELTWSGADACSSTVDHYRITGGGIERTVPAGVDRVWLSPEREGTATYEVVAVAADGRESSPATVEGISATTEYPIAVRLEPNESTIEVGETTTADIVIDPIQYLPGGLEDDLELTVQLSSACVGRFTSPDIDPDTDQSVQIEPEEPYRPAAGEPWFSRRITFDDPIELDDPVRIGSIGIAGEEPGASAIDVSVETTLRSSFHSASNWTHIEVVEPTGPSPAISNLGLVEWGNTIDVYWDVDDDGCPSFETVELRANGDVLTQVQPGVNRVSIRQGGFITVRTIDADGQRSRPLMGYREITSLIADPGTDVYAKTPQSAIAPGESIVVPLECRTLVGSPPNLYSDDEVVVEVSLVDSCTASITDATPVLYDDGEWLFGVYEELFESEQPFSAEIADDGSAATIRYSRPGDIPAFGAYDPPVGAIELTGQGVGATNLYATLDRFHSEPPSYPWSTVQVSEPDPIDGTMPTDPDADGLYEDFSGDGTVNFPDVNTLFQRTDSGAVQDDAQFYDFDGDDDVDLQDVLALFETI